MRVRSGAARQQTGRIRHRTAPDTSGLHRKWCVDAPLGVSLRWLQGSRSNVRTWRGWKTAIGRRSKVAIRRTPSRSAVATRTASASRGRCSAAAVEELGRPAQVGVRRRDQPDAAAGDRPQQGEGRLEAELALEQEVQLGEGQRAEQQRLVGPREPGHRRGVVEVGLVGGREDRARVEQDRHGGRRLSAGRSAGGRPRAGRSSGRRARAGRAGSARWRGTRRSGASSCSARYASSAAVMTAVLVVRARVANRARRSSRSASARIVVRCVVI